MNPPSIAPGRSRVIGRIADHLIARRSGHPVRVAVDGVTAAGKTTLADELAAAVAARGGSAIRLSMDGYHHPRAHRHRQGRDSASGYYEDAYDFASFARLVLTPLGPTGDLRYCPAILDLAQDETLELAVVTAERDAILIVDGSFLQRSELAGLWDEVVFVDTELSRAKARGSSRDAEQFGSVEIAEKAFDDRYHAACRRYLHEVDPESSASIVVNNDDLAEPALRRIGGATNAVVPLFSYGTLQLPDVQVAHSGGR